VERKRAVLVVYSLSWVGIGAMLLAIAAAPVLEPRFPRWSGFIYGIFAPFCHQIPERCFRLAGHPLAVCARCLGVYLGFAAGLVLYPIVRGTRDLRPPSLRLFLLISTPTAADVAGNVLGLWTSSPWLRFGLATAWGTLLPFFFITGLVDAMTQIRRGDRRSNGP